MTNNEKLSTLAPARTSQHFSALREEGIDLIGQLAEKTWTDHNVHDPGITFLEAFSYALTDIGFRTQLDMADLLQSSEKTAPSALPPAHQVLPCAPVTLLDLRKVVLDHYLVKEAAISTNITSEVAFYQDNTLQPPLSYNPGDNRVQLSGLFEVLIEFNDSPLNSNSYLIPIEFDATDYILDIALPHWDETEAFVFQEALSIDSITLVDTGAGAWRALEETQTYFAQLTVNYTGANGPGSQQLWMVLRVVNEVSLPVATLPLLLDAAALLITNTSAESLVGQFAERVLAARTAVATIQRYLNNWRNLTQVPLRIAVVREQEIAVRAHIEINSGIDLEALVANIFWAIALELSPSSRLSTLEQLQELGFNSSEIYDGPLLQHGFLTNTQELDSLSTTAAKEIYTSDILRLIMRLRSAEENDVTVQESIAGRDILSVSDLALSNYINNRLITEGATDCLRLVDITHYRPRLSLAKSQIILIRDDIEVVYDFNRVEQLFQQLIDDDLANQISEAPTHTWPVTEGDQYPVDDYYPFQNELPIIYGVGNIGLPDSASTQRKAQALQTKAYLLLAEQFLADSAAQLANINRFFSPSADENQSYFVQPLYDLAGIDKLIKNFPANGDWQAFSDDPNNAYQRALQSAIENSSQFVDRRNRMLDHLLARHGVEALAWSQELHRWSYQILKNANLPAAQFQSQLNTRRLEVNASLIAMKAAFLADVPYLNAYRYQAFAHPAHKRSTQAELITIVTSPSGYTWQLVLDEEIVLTAINESSTHAAAYIQAEEAITLATQALYYQVESAGGGRFHYVLHNGPNNSDQIIGHSLQTWSTPPTTQTAIDQIAATFIQLTLASSLSAMERIIAHQCGFYPQQRRRLLINSDAYFEIYDESDSDSIIEKRWRLWGEASYSGPILLSGVFHFTAPPEIVDPLEQETIANNLAQAAIEEVKQFGLYQWNYVISTAGAETFNFDLRNTQGEKIALYIPPLPSVADTQQNISQTALFLQRLFSAEGFHLVEHILLRPQQNGDTFLSITVNNTTQESDPYSHHVSLVFPSGYARDFDEPSETAIRSEVAPQRFRDKEFRQYVQRVVEQTCPAHILPTLYWVDQQLPATANNAGSFTSFEERYFNWLQALLTAGTPSLTLDTNRLSLIESLNAIAND